MIPAGLGAALGEPLALVFAVFLLGGLALWLAAAFVETRA